MEDLRAIFLKKYADLPFGTRDEIIAVIDGEPFSWRSARIEIEEDTQKGNQILEMLRKMKIL